MLTLAAVAALVGAPPPLDSASAWSGSPYQANAALSADEAFRLVEVVLILVDKEKPATQRVEAAEIIRSRMPHRAAVPALASVARDGRTDQQVRSHAIIALSFVDDKSVIPLLIELVNDGNAGVRKVANRQLWKLAAWHRPHSIRVADADTPAADLELAVKSWKEWWKKTEPTYRFSRSWLIWQPFMEP
jgi:HEAT repeat protein